MRNKIKILDRLKKINWINAFQATVTAMLSFSVIGLSAALVTGGLGKATGGYNYVEPPVIKNYVSLGDSIAAGHSINDEWASNYGEISQYGVNGNKVTKIVPGSYTHKMSNGIKEAYNADRVNAVSFARSGETVRGLMKKLDDETVKNAISKAHIVTICIGANDVLIPAIEELDDYISDGDLTTLEGIVEDNLNDLNYDKSYTKAISFSEIKKGHTLVANKGNTKKNIYIRAIDVDKDTGKTIKCYGTDLDNNTSITINDGDFDSFDRQIYSYKRLFDKLKSINPSAKFVFTTIYNPYKYLWVEEEKNGFFKPLLDSIPQISLLWGTIEVDEYIKSIFLEQELIQLLFDRVNGLGDWTETYVNKLNDIIKGRVATYRNVNFLVTDSKALFDTIPDRMGSGEVHYNDLVNVEYTRGYDTSKMDWGRLWNGTVITDKDGNVLSNTVCNDSATFWSTLIDIYVDDLDFSGLVNTLRHMVTKYVVTPDIDPHPENYGHDVLFRSFADTLGLSSLNKIKFNSGDGIGEMKTQKVLSEVDGRKVFSIITPNTFEHSVKGYYFNGWKNSKGASYADSGSIHVTADTTLYAQWSNMYTITYMHTNHTNLMGNDETGHKECYALWIDGVEQDDFGKFSEGSQRKISVAYGTRVGVVCGCYKKNDLQYDDAPADIYFNGENVTQRFEDGTTAYYEFNVQGDMTIDFRWKIAGSLINIPPDAQSWEDCYITTH